MSRPSVFAALAAVLLSFAFAVSASAQLVEPEWRAPRDLKLPDEPLRIEQAGRPRAFDIALDEVAVRGVDGRTKLEKVAPRSDAQAMRSLLRAPVSGASPAKAASGLSRGLVLYETGRPRSEHTRVLATREFVVELRDSVSPESLAQELQAEYQGELSYAPGFHRFRAADAAEALLAPESLRQRDGVLRVLPQIARLHVRTTVPNDPFYADQWHLDNTGQLGGSPGVDINVESAWDTVRGAGVVIGIVDDGVQASHPDLAPNIRAALGYDFRAGDADPSPNLVTPNLQDPLNDPSEDDHGTLVAGVAAGRGFNGIGISGVAPEAGIAALRLIGDYFTDLTGADVIAHRNDVIAVKNNSWGPRDDGATLSGPDILSSAALEAATTSGRGGRGTVLVWAAGNGGEENDNANKNGYANSIYTIAVGALDDRGVRASYSEVGSNILITAPAGGRLGARTATTDLLLSDGLNYTGAPGELSDLGYSSDFAGTSSSSPMVSGVAALMLNANANLGWRDVQEILVRTARKTDATDPSWFLNAAGFWFSDQYGAGLVDASAAVALARTWTNLAPMRSSARDPQETLPVDIPDGVASGLTRTFDFSGVGLRVEQVQVRVFIEHPFRGEIEASLQSPSGTISRLIGAHEDDAAGYYDWTFSSVQHWGENAAGLWTLRIADRASGQSGRLWQATVTLHGTETATPLIPATPRALAVSAPSVNELELTWSDPATNETGYQIEFSNGWGSPWTLEATLPANSTRWTSRNVPQSQEFYFRVKALNGAQSSAYTTPAFGQTQDGHGAIIFKADFEPAEGYLANSALAGKDNWVAAPNTFAYPGHGVVPDAFTSRGRPGLGQQAYVGKSLSGGGQANSVYQPIFYDPEPDTIVRIKSLFSVVDSTNRAKDAFAFDIYNSDGVFLLEVLFDNSDRSIYYATAANTTYVSARRTFVNGQVYAFEVAIDFASNQWSLSIDGQTLVSGIALTGGVNPPARTLGTFDAAWYVTSTSRPGNNYLLFDQVVIDQVAKVGPPVPTQFNVSAIGTSLIVVDWTGHPLAETYELQRSPNGVNDWAPLATILEDTLFYLDPELETATPYHYRMRARNALGMSAFTPVEWATTYTEYEDWKDSYRLPITAADTSDDDRDGIPLLMEYALALSPKRSSGGGLPDLINNSADSRLELTYHRPRSELTYSVETSIDLMTWTTVGVTQQRSVSGRYITASVPITSPERRFLRLVVSR